MNSKLKKICVPMNFSPCALNSLRIAILIAVENHASLHVLHITKIMSAQQFANVRRKVAQMLKKVFKNVCENTTRNGGELVDALDLKIEYIVKMGNVGSNIHDYEIMEEIDLTIRERTAIIS